MVAVGGGGGPTAKMDKAPSTWTLSTELSTSTFSWSCLPALTLTGPSANCLSSLILTKDPSALLCFALRLFLPLENVILTPGAGQQPLWGSTMAQICSLVITSEGSLRVQAALALPRRVEQPPNTVPSSDWELACVYQVK